MASQIYVNLPVQNLDRSMHFFSRLGFGFDSNFCDEKAACLIVGENIYVMLLTEPFFRSFTRKKTVDAEKYTEVILCISASSRREVDDMVNKALEAGGSAPNPKQDHGYMYGHGFQDPDGHLWEVMYMDMRTFNQ